MDITNAELANALHRMSAELATLVAKIQGRPAVKFPPAAQEKLDRRICLNCGAPVPPEKRYTRGLDSTCNQRIRSLLLANKTTESELIEKGLLAPPTSGGRKRSRPSAIDEMLRESPESDSAMQKAKAAAMRSLEESRKKKSSSKK